VISSAIEPQTVWVWPVRLQAPDAIVTHYAGLLSPDESERAGRFAFEYLRRSFTLARGALRILLGRALRQSPGSIRLSYGEKGKPGLAAPGPLRFNAAHSVGLGLFAITQDREIGVDIERVRPVPDLMAIAERFFSEEERNDLTTLAEDQREAAFFRCWTRKEAYIKAIGDGLSAPLEAFAVSLRPGEPARMIHLGGDTTAAAAWTLHDLAIEPGYAAALAYPGSLRAIRLSPVVEPAELLDA
jgi:4'-phosphopantetheinyl transferase